MKLLFHAHTTYSHDGHLRPAELAASAARRGFSAVYLSDHFEHLDRASFAELVRECDGLAGPCRLVPGYERDWQGFHLNAYGVREWIDEPQPSSWADRVRAAGGLVCLAHWSRYQREVPEHVLDWCDAIEVWNSKWPYDGILGPRPDAYSRLGSRIALAGQDVHKRRDFSSLAVELADQAPHDPPWRALRSGRYLLSSRLLRLRGRPGPALSRLLRLWHPPRRAAWGIAARVVKLARRGLVVRR